MRTERSESSTATTPVDSTVLDETSEVASTDEAAATAASEGATSTADDDAAMVAQANALLAALCADPLMAVEIAQNWLRDLGIDVREDSALSAQDQAHLSELLADAAHELEAAARASAAESNLIGQVFGWIGTVIAVAVSVVASVFTGGASLALGAAAIACMVAAQTFSVLGSEGVIDDPNVANAFSIGFSIAGTILSFGAGAVGGGAQAASSTGSAVARAAAEAAMQAARTAIEAVSNGLKLANATVTTIGAVNDMIAAVHTHDGDMAEIDGERHELRADDARFEVEENTDGLASMMRQFRQMAERRAEVREARAAAMSAAMIRV